ncbi:MAG: hypothetical protein ACKV2V_23125 [Blastocatellia bacterium]
MKRIVSCLIVALSLLCLLRQSTISHAEQAVTPRAVVTKSLPLLQTLGTKFIEASGCVSCHNNSLPAMAVAIARERGFKIDEQAVQQENAKIAGLWGAKRESYLQGGGAPGGIDTASYILVGMAANGQPANATTDAVVHFLAGQQTRAGNWEITIRSRPPLEASHFNATALSLRALQLYAPKGRGESVKQQIARARQWLTKATPQTNEDRAFQLFGLHWSGADQATKQKAATQLLALQRGDGGWAQLPTMTSDAFATGQSLVALHRAGGLPATDPAYQRGVQYLLGTWQPDGTWHVQSRSFPFQKQFESGFPYGKDQWISAAATSWAVMALTLTIDLPANAGTTINW